MRNLIIGAIIALACGATSAAADDLGHGAERQLRGHAFLPSVYVRDPWISTSVENLTGGGVAIGLETPFVDVDGTTLYTLKGNLLYASLGLGFQQKLGDRFAVGLRVTGLVRSGTNGQTLIASGANVDRNLNTWFRYRVVRTESSQFTAGLDWNYSKTFVITPLEFARGILAGEELDEAALLYHLKNWSARATMNYAHAFSPEFGLRLDGAIGLYEEPTSSGVSKATHRLGVMTEYDLIHRAGIPLGITLGYTFGFPDDDPGAGLSGTLLGFWYTGEEAFVVGVETGFMKLPVAGDQDKIEAAFGLFTIRYYF